MTSEIPGTSEGPKPILVGVDGSDSALEAVRWAATEAHLRSAGLRLVRAFGWMPTDAPAEPLDRDYAEVLRQDAREQLAQAAKLAAEVAPDAEVTGEVLPDYPIPRLVTEAGRAQLVVVGDRGLGGLSGLMVGSVAVALASHAACPVVVVRGAGVGGAGPADGPVVVGVDRSPAAGDALRFAFEAADRRNAVLQAVHTWHLPVLFVPQAWAMIDWDAFAAAESRLLDARLAEWVTRYPEVHVERIVARDRAAPVLVDRSVGAQLVVVGSSGRGSLAGLVLGSVSHSVLHQARCPVAVVRAGTVEEPH